MGIMRKARLHFKSIRYKILLYFLVLIVPSVLVGMISYNISVNVVTDMAIDSVENMIDRIDFETNRLMNDLQNFATMISRDSSIQIPLRDPLPDNIADVFRQRLDFNYRLYYTNQYREEVRGFYVVGENGARFKSTMMTPKDLDFREQDWYKEVINSGGGVWFEPHIDSFVATTVGEDLISVGVPIIDRFLGGRLGVVLVDLEVARFRDNYEAQLIRQGVILLLNANGEVILSPEAGSEKSVDKATIDGLLANYDFSGNTSTQMIKLPKASFLVSHKTLSINGWKTLGIIPNSEISKDASTISLAIAMLIGIVCVGVVFFAIQASSSISRPIQKMRDTMKEVQDGDLSVRADIPGEDEIGQLAKSFNSMIGQINVLIKEQQEDQTKLRKAELRALQAQINPHFLYNTLDSISWMARSKKVEQLDETIEALTTLFRISLSRGRDLITLEDEIRHVHSYLRIQQIRYSKKMSYLIDVPRELSHCLIVKMSLQPLVENAIYHGIKEKREKGLVSITGSLQNGEIIIKIEDTGKGMEPDKVAALNALLLTGEDINVDSYGVINVNKRLQMYFGEQYGLSYKSELNKGTIVTLKIPKKQEGEI